MAPPAIRQPQSPTLIAGIKSVFSDNAFAILRHAERRERSDRRSHRRPNRPADRKGGNYYRQSGHRRSRNDQIERNHGCTMHR
jgi:hypothetical protein